MRFRVGQKVRIKPREYLETQKSVWPEVNKTMLREAGKIVIIADILRASEGYAYKFTGSIYWWHTNWIEEVKEEIEDILCNIP